MMKIIKNHQKMNQKQKNIKEENLIYLTII